MAFRRIITLVAALVVCASLSAGIPGERKKAEIMVVSGWQNVNIGDIAHTPGMLGELRSHYPDAIIRLWKYAAHDEETAALYARNFPDVEVFYDRPDKDFNLHDPALIEAIKSSDLLIHSSGPMLVAHELVMAWRKLTDKPYGAFGITTSNMWPAEEEILDHGAFLYTRETESWKELDKAGIIHPDRRFIPDVAYSFNCRDDEKADAFIKANGLKDREFLVIVPRLRYTPYWLLDYRKGDFTPEVIAERTAVNDEWKEKDHEKLRTAIITWVRKTGNPVVLCPEMTYATDIMDELLIDPLPDDVKGKVIKHGYWMPDEAASLYARAACVVSLECHSPIIALRAGTPAIYVRQKEDTIKGHMYYDLGLNKWVFEVDESSGRSIAKRVMDIYKHPEKAERYRRAAVAKAARLIDEGMESLSKYLRTDSGQGEAPAIGAQVFIEPGQSAEQIDGFFADLEKHGLTVARMRLFGVHMQKPEGGWDFSLYDKAFDAAARHNVRIFGTLFPPTDELTDVGGFKFPRSMAHQAEVADYIHAVVSHYCNHPAMDTWVLVNEPGTGGMRVHETDLSREIRAEWEKTHTYSRPLDAFLKADFSEQEFLVYYNTWYLGWLAEQVRSVDQVHPLHANPHSVLGNMQEYDFPAYRRILSSLGTSVHFSWHFYDFLEEDFIDGVSMMAEIIREGSGYNPFWITELQGGFSMTATRPFCPGADLITQSLWQGVAAGARGAVFWSYNQRKAVSEAGEWGLATYDGTDSDRMTAAAKVAAAMPLVKDAVPRDGEIWILYNPESLWMQKHHGNSDVTHSMIAAYQAISELGAAPGITSMEDFDWSPVLHPVAVVPHMVCIPDKYLPRMENYVKEGGKLILTGLSGYYDEHMACRMMDESPVWDVLGGRISEFKVRTGERNSMYGIIHTPGSTEDKSSLTTRYGKGTICWFPRTLDLDAYNEDIPTLARFYESLCADAAELAPVRFHEKQKKVLMRLMDTPEGTIAVITNHSGVTKKIRLDSDRTRGELLFGNGASLKGRRLSISGNGTAVVLFK